MKNLMKTFSGAALLVLAGHVGAQGDKPQQDKDSLEKVKASIQAGLEKGRPGLEVTNVEESALPGMYKAVVGNGPHVYITGDGKHFISGDIYEVREGNIVNLTEFERNDERAAAMVGIDKKDMIIFSPKKDVKKVLYVFTDVDCGYCQLMHSKMSEYNEMGIEVRYLAYPRAGINSDSYKKIASAWCAENPNEALTKLKNREEIPENVCETNPVGEQYNIGRQIGLSGTPAIVLEDGELIAGYLEPAKLKARLNL